VCYDSGAFPHDRCGCTAADGTEEAAGAGMIILAGLLAGLLVALIVIRIMAGRMNTVGKQDSAKGYGQKLMLTEKSDAFLYSRTTSRRVNN